MINARTRTEADELCAQSLCSVLYTSRATERFDPEDLGSMLKMSRAKNWIRNLTGLLLYQDGRFLHYLEGPTDEVHERMGRIRLDARHSDISPMSEHQVRTRLFPRWTMAYVSVPDADDVVPGLRNVFERLGTSPDASATTGAVAGVAAWFAEQRH